MKIGYLSFGRDDFVYGLALCLDRLRGHELFRITPKTARYVDVILFSCFWWEHIYLLSDFMRAAGIKKSDINRPRIVVGGFNTFNPLPFTPYADAVVCGDGEEIAEAVVNGIDPGLIWRNTQTIRAFAHETNGITRIEIARGCRHRCRFCAVAHLKPYREVAIKEIETAVLKSKGKRVSLFAPEPTLHSQDDEITELCRRAGKTRVDSDVRLDRLAHRSDSVPRVGIEGLSARLRKSVNKPYSDRKVIEAVSQAIRDGRKGLFMYLILDLPGETDDDWAAFRELLIKIGRLKGAGGFLIKPSPSVFMPNPWTPMEYEEIHYDRDYAGKWSRFFGRGPERDWEVMVAERSRVFSPAMRVLSMIATRSGGEFAEIESTLSRRKIIRVSNGSLSCQDFDGLIKALDAFGGVDRYCGRLDVSQAPWKKLSFAGP